MSVRTLLAALFVTVSSSAFAGNEPFKTEVDCVGTHVPGDTLNYILEIEERVNQTHDVDYMLEVITPNRGAILLASGSTVIRPNTTRFIDRTLRIPLGAVNGRFSLRLTGTSATHTSVDTCSFHVQ